MSIEPKKRGRKPGTLSRYTCRVCAAQELAKGGSNKFVCSVCIAATGPFYTEWSGSGGMYAMGVVQKAVAEGRLPVVRTLCCSDCGCQAVHYDHRDYNKPLMVEPVCHSCNMKRGPAIPRVGFFADMYRTGQRYYTRLKDMRRIFQMIGVEADLSSLPGRLTFEHWLPFKDALLEWEAKLVA